MDLWNTTQAQRDTVARHYGGRAERLTTGLWMDVTLPDGSSIHVGADYAWRALQLPDAQARAERDRMVSQ